MTRFETVAIKILAIVARRAGAYLILLCALIASAPSAAHAQGSRKDDIAFGAAGKPLAGATVTVCSAGATGVPCSPLATLYTDDTLTTPSTNPLQADGLGNYHFYAAPGRYVVQISGSGINPYTMQDTILPNDPTTPSFNSVTATSLTLGGNLSVGGNTSVTGTLSAGTFAPATVTTGTLQVSGNSAFAGPRPWVDPIAYGADPSGSADSTSAIQSALNAVCSTGGALHFSPGAYKVSQPQTPSTAPVLSVPSTCHGLTIEGSSAVNGPTAQFSRPPKARIFVVNGSSPNLAPVFLLNQPASGNQPTSFRDLEIDGYNQAVQLNSTTNVEFDHVTLTVGNTGNGIRTGATDNTDNTPLAIYNTFWVWFFNGVLLNTSGSTSTPIAVFAFLAQAPPNLGLFEFRDVVGSGGGFIWDCRGTSGTNNCPNGGGNVYFDDVQIENGTMAFYTINDTAGVSPSFQGVPVYFNNDGVIDCTTWPFMNYNTGAANGPIGGIFMQNVTPCSGGQILTETSGVVKQTAIFGDSQFPMNSSGVPAGNATIQTEDGTGFVSSNLAACSQNIEQENLMYIADGCGNPRLPPIGMGQSGSALATIGISPYYGHEFADGTHYGFESSLIRNSANTLDLDFSCALAPTGLAATPTTGGSLANGTYRYSIQTNCASGGTKSAGSAEVSVTLSGSNNAVALSWAAPAGSNPGSCNIFRSTSAGGTFSSSATNYTSAACASTTTFTDTGAAGSTGGNTYVNSSQAPYFHFQPSTANPSGGNVPIYTGTPSSGNCVKWGSGGLLQDSGAACGSGGGGGTLTFFAPPPNVAGSVQIAPSATNAVNVIPFLVPVQLQFSKLTIDIGTADSTGGDLYDVGIYSMSGALECNWGATPFTATGPTDGSCAQGTVTLAPGNYVFAFTGNATAAKIYPGNAYNTGFEVLSSATSSSTSSGGALPSTIAVPSVCPACGSTTASYASPFIVMH